MSESKDLFITLLWDDILCAHLLPYLSMKELFILRGLSSSYKALIDLYFVKLDTINLASYQKKFNQAALKVFADLCTHLRVINLCGCEWLKDDMVIPLVMNNPNLTELNLSYCMQLTTASLQPVIRNCKNLQSLSLAGCIWINAGCLQALALHQNSLHTVKLDKCLIDSDTLCYLLTKFPRLKTLSLENIITVDDNTLAKIAKHCRELEHLNVRCCFHITGYGVSMVAEYCQQLKTLSLVGCPKVRLLNQDYLSKRIKMDIEMPEPFFVLRNKRKR